MRTAADVIHHARQCRETPFVHQGRQPGVGLDCAGLIVHAYRAAGLPATDETRYGRQPHPGQMRAALERRLVRAAGPWQPADILWFRIQADPQHLALWTGDGILHAYLSAGRVVETSLDARWQNRLVARYRHPGLIDGADR